MTFVQKRVRACVRDALATSPRGVTQAAVQEALLGLASRAEVCGDTASGMKRRQSPAVCHCSAHHNEPVIRRTQ